MNLGLIVTLVASPNASAQEEDSGKKTVKDPIGYFLGVSIGQQLRQSGFRTGDFQFDEVLSGFKDGIAE